MDAIRNVTSATPLASLPRARSPTRGLYHFLSGRWRLPRWRSRLHAVVGGSSCRQKGERPPHPPAFLGTDAALTFHFPHQRSLTWMFYEQLSAPCPGPSSCRRTIPPPHEGRQWIYGVGCGLIHVFNRYFGSYPEGVASPF
jgi:hypothetical protein